jgi:hypothetical protein
MKTPTEESMRRPHTWRCAVLFAALVALRGSGDVVAAEHAPGVDGDSRLRLERAIAQKEYEASRNGEGLQAPNRAHNLRTYFDPGGIRVVERTAPQAPTLADLRLRRVGRGKSLKAVPPGTLTSAGPRVEVRRPDLVEWYVNSPAGVEQGFTVNRRLRGSGPLTLEMSVRGSRATLRGDSVDLVSSTGRRLVYGHLRVADAKGAPVRASLAVPDPERVQLVVDDRNARYPLTIDPLLTDGAYAVLESDQANAVLGFSVAAAGDVNGDGYGDVIVGAPLYDVGGLESGAAFVFHGGPTGIAYPPTAAKQLAFGTGGSQFGNSVAGAGDVNGDGYDDVIVGAPTLRYSGITNGGAALVYYGSPGGLLDPPGGVPDYLVSFTEGSYLGGTVAGAGDVNGDGYGDVIVGAHRFDVFGSPNGAAFILLGSASGVGANTPEVAATELLGDQNGCAFGVVAGAGDVNGDGYADVIIGAPQYDYGTENGGLAAVFLGGPAGIPSGGPLDATFLFPGDKDDANLGASVAGAGDVDGDGYADVIIGAPFYDAGQFEEGVAYVVRGFASTLPQSRIESNEEVAHLGASVASAGDVNGDGYADVIVGTDTSNGGAAFVFLGSATGVADGNPASAAAALTIGSSARFGYSVAGAGDVNGDGYTDVIVGAHAYSNGQTAEGAAFVYLGGARGIVSQGDPATANTRLDSNQAGASFGLSTAGAGDVNGDGYGDVIVGAPYFDAGEEDEGAAFVFLGSAAGIGDANPATAATQLQADVAFSNFGYSVAGAGDVNGDGYADVIVGAEYYGPEPGRPGAAFVFLGSSTGIPDGNPMSAATRLSSEQAGGALSLCVAGAGDVNGDGFADVIVGFPYYDAGQLDGGAAFVFLGSATGVADGSPMTAASRIESDVYRGVLGYSVAGAGDVNGDGYADVIVGAPEYFDASPEGRAFVFLGSPTGIIARGHPANADAELSGASLGWSVASAGDVNGDGYGDVILGAPDFSDPEPSEGAAYIFLGSSGGIADGDPSSAASHFYSDQAGVFLGRSVAGAGDVNGDGYADVIVGADLYSNGEAFEGGAFLFHGGPEGVLSENAGFGAAQLEANQPDAFLGGSVSAAGDVNGDGYADVIVGASGYDAGSLGEGAAFVFLGNNGNAGGRPVQPQQLRGGSTQTVEPWGRSSDPTAFQVRLAANNPAGRGPVKLEIEACPPGVAFGTSCAHRISPAWVDPTAGTATLTANVDALAPDVLYHWRARVLYAPPHVTAPGITAPPNPPHGPWRRLQAMAREADIATGVPVGDDGDGVSDAVENGAPNGGDANGDGMPDSAQQTVTSLPAGDRGAYVTVETDCGELHNVYTMSEADEPIQDPQADYPLGLIGFRIPCPSATVRIAFHGATRLALPYRKFGPTTPGAPATAAWYALPTAPPAPYAEVSSVVIGGRTVPVMVLHLVDGVLGDDTGVDGQIVDVGGPGAPLTLLGKALMIQDDPDPINRKIAATLKDPGVSSAVPDSDGDPRCTAPGGGGGSLRAFGTGGSGQDTGVIALPCANWSLVGKPEAQKGYRYRDPEQDQGPCKQVVVKAGKVVKAVCTGKNPASPVPYDLTAAGEHSVGVVLTTGASAQTYCAAFPGATGEIRADHERRFSAINAPAPAACPVP